MLVRPVLTSAGARRYTATDHREFDQTLKHCPASAFCRNCMPINETADSCWAVKTPVLYKVKSYGKIEKPKHGNIVRPSHPAVHTNVAFCLCCQCCFAALQAMCLLMAPHL